MLTWKVKRPLAPYLIRQKVAEIKWGIRKVFAIEYIAGKCTIEDAAEEAGVSSRQMRRWVSDLLKEHHGMKFVDLRHLSEGRRERLAREIEASEQLHLAQQQALKALNRGQKGLENAAIEALLTKK